MTVHSEVHVGPDCIEQLDTLVDAHDGPFGDSSALPAYAVSQLARESVTVALSGEGSDEIFGGYPRFRAMERASRVPGWAAAVRRKIVSFLPRDPHLRDPRRRNVRFLEAAGLPEEERWLHWVGFFVSDLGRVMKQDAGPLPDLAASIRKAMNGRSNVLARSLSANFGTHLVDDLLVKADRMGMANSLELRMPFLDTDLVEYTAGLPPGHLRRRGTLKHLLRKAFSDVVPRWCSTGGNRVLRCLFRTGFVAPGVGSCMNACSRPTHDCGSGWIGITSPTGLRSIWRAKSITRKNSGRCSLLKHGCRRRNADPGSRHACATR